MSNKRQPQSKQRICPHRRRPARFPRSAGMEQLEDRRLLAADDVQFGNPRLVSHTLELSPQSDSGTFDDDNVTNFSRPMFTGVGQPGSTVSLFADDQLVGTGTVGSDRSDGTIGDGLGAWAITTGALRDDTYDFTAVVEAGEGNGHIAGPLTVEIDTLQSNTPLLDLITSSDTGHSSTDNITRIRNPTFNLTTKDPGQADHISPFNYKYRLFVRLDSGVEELVYESAGDDEIPASATDGVFTSLENLRRTITRGLPDGVHNFKLEVEDRAGNISEDFLLNVQVDASVAGGVTIHLLRSSDSGRDQRDGITKQNQPAFSGLGEAGGRVTLFAGDNPVGTGIVGSDDSDGTPDDGLGLWEITSEPLVDGVYDVTAMVEDDAGNSAVSPDVTIEIDTLPTDTPLLDLITSSDTGHSNNDNITSSVNPTFNMVTRDPNQDDHVNALNYIYRLSVRLDSGVEALLYDSVGDPNIPISATDGTFTSLENLRRTILRGVPDGTHNFKLEVEDRAGNLSVDFLLNVTVDTRLMAPDTGITVDLIDAADSGVVNSDNTTNINQPAVAGVAEVGAVVSIFADGVLVGTGTVGSDETDFSSGDGLGSWEVTIEPLVDGQYEIVAHVEDWAGNFERSLPLTIEIDTLEPNTPHLGVTPASDTGGAGDDEITSTFTFTTQDPNQAEHLSQFNYLYRLFLRQEGTREVLIYDSSLDTTIPAMNLQDGLTDLEFLERTLGPFSAGGYNLKLEVEDRAGNISHDVTLNVEADSTMPGMAPGMGPKIENVTRADEGFTSLFDPKPSGGPDPLVHSIVVHFSDASARLAVGSQGAVRPETVLEEGNYRLVGDANGNIPIVNVSILTEEQGPEIARTAVQLTFRGPLPDDRYTFIVFDRITDPAGNSLDGESGAAAPFVGHDALTPTAPIFPTGDGNPGGDFEARFTIDSRPEIGVWAAGNVWTDTNGNFTFDSTNVDFVNRDIAYTIGFASDYVFAGNFAAEGNADGFDKLAVYGRVHGTFRWLIDVDNDGVADIDSTDAWNISGLPVAGRFDTNDDNGDEVGIYTGSYWYFDTDHDFKLDQRLESNLRGYPIVGDFDGDGFDDLGAWSDDEFQFDLTQGIRGGWDGKADVSFRFGFIGARERPVAADMDHDGFDDVGLWAPDRTGLAPRETGEWFWLISGGASVLDRTTAALDAGRNQPRVSFTPIPFGNDIFATFGNRFALPVVGNFDPPVLPALTADTSIDRIFTNPVNLLDVNGDGNVTPVDALLVINHLNDRGTTTVNELWDDDAYLDVNGDGSISPVDALVIINALNAALGEARERDAAAEVDETIELIAADVASALLDTITKLDVEIDGDESR